MASGRRVRIGRGSLLCGLDEGGAGARCKRGCVLTQLFQQLQGLLVMIRQELSLVIAVSGQPLDPHCGRLMLGRGGGSGNTPRRA
jgi:hypothetical protein